MVENNFGYRTLLVQNVIAQRSAVKKSSSGILSDFQSGLGTFVLSSWAIWEGKRVHFENKNS